MDFISPFYSEFQDDRANESQKQFKTLNQALSLVKQAVTGEREDELFYDYLISQAPDKEQKDIITSIRNDERKHNKYFREIYYYFTKENIKSPENVEFKKPDSYIDGIKKAKMGELSAVERYRDIRAGLPTRYYRDMVFEIITDEIKHAAKYDYILHLNVQGKRQDLYSRKQFTMEDAQENAKKLGIDFSSEAFDQDQFLMGLNMELEHGTVSSLTNITDDNPIITAKIVLSHLRKFPNYYTMLRKLEEQI